ncbi:MAG: GAF domain-containing protein [Anaerolineales bacterium]|nr:GAF domain-containing protein [Anaerolineales bacterium]
MIVTRKLLIPLLVLLTLVLFGVQAYNGFQDSNFRSEAEEREAARLATVFENRTNSLQAFALALATEVANNPEVQAAFAAKDRLRLIELTLPAYEVIDAQFDVPQHQFHLPPATSFLRLHQLDRFGDDLSSFRFTVLKANETQQPAAGLEIGRGGLGVRGVVPVSYQGEHVGTVEFGVNVDQTLLNQLKQGLDADWQLLLRQDPSQVAIFEGAVSGASGPTADLFLQASTLSTPVFADPADYARVLAGEPVFTQRINAGDATVSLYSFPVRDFSGSVIGVAEVVGDRSASVAQAISRGVAIVVSTVIGIVLAGVALGAIVTRIMRPIGSLTETAAAIAAGQLDRQVQVDSDDEIGALAAAFNSMTTQLRDLVGSLETQVASRTQDLNLAADIGRRVSQVQDLDALLAEAVNLIRDRFDLYYTQIYLVDAATQSLRLRAGTGEAGEQLLARGHALPIDTTSINGTAACQKEPVLVADTAAGPAFRPNPLLPATRAELAVPLIVAGSVRGVLNLQSADSHTLTPAILPAFEALAGQLAVAIDNATLFAERQRTQADVARFKLGIEQSSSAVFLTGVDGTIQYVNPAFETVYGYTAAEAVGDTPRIIKSGLIPPDQYAAFWSTLLSGHSVTGEIPNRHKDGRIINIEASNNPIVNDEGVLTGFLAVHTDITARKSAETALAKRAAELETVARVGTSAATAQDPDQLLQEVVDLAQSSFGLYHAAAYLLDRPRQTLSLAVGAGDAGRQLAAAGHTVRLAESLSPVARAARTRQGVIVNDVRAGSDFAPHPLLPETRAEMAVPLIIGDTTLGVLYVQADTANAFSEQDLQIQTTLAAQTAVALQNAYQYQATQAALANTETLLTVTRVASGSLELETTLTQVLDELLTATRFDHGLISMLNRETAALQLTAHRLPADMVQGFLTNGLSGTLCDLVYRERQSIVLTDMTQDAPIDVAGLTARGFHAYQGVPIEARGEILGTICLFSQQPLPANTDSTSLLQAVGQQIGIAIQNALLFAQTQAALAEAETFRNLVENAGQGIGIASLDGYLSYVNPALRQLLGIDPHTRLAARPLASYYDAADEEFLATVVRTTVGAQGQWQGELNLMPRAGQSIPTLQNYILIRDNAGTPIRLAVIITDITDRKQAEEAQQQLARQLEEQLQQVNALQRAMSHEGWQAFLQAQERPYQGYQFDSDTLRRLEEPSMLPAHADALLNLQVQGATIGVLGARDPAGKPLDAETNLFLRQVSEQVAEALERARLFEETELSRQALDQRAVELATINDITEVASSQLELHALLEVVGERLQHTFDAEAVHFALYHEQTEMVTCPYFNTRTGGRITLAPRSVHAGGFTAQIIQSRHPLLVNVDSAADNLETLTDAGAIMVSSSDEAVERTTDSFLGVPVIVAGRLIGVIGLSSYQETRTYTLADQQLMMTLAGTIGVAIENARQFEATRRRAEREALINAISQKIQSAPTVERALQTTLTELGQALKARQAMIELTPTGEQV